MFGHRHDDRIDALSKVPLFEGCGYGEVEKVAQLAGEAVVQIDGDEVARLHAGDIVGEMALLEREPRVATVVATDDVRALVLTPNGFKAVLDASPTVTRRVMATLAHRLREVQAA